MVMFGWATREREVKQQKSESFLSGKKIIYLDRVDSVLTQPNMLAIEIK